MTLHQADSSSSLGLDSKIREQITTMVSKSKKPQGQQGSEAMANLTMKLTKLKREIHHERIVSVGEKLEKNSQRVQAYVSDLKILAASRNDCTAAGSNGSGNLLSMRMSDPLFELDKLIEGSADRDDSHSQEVSISAPIKFPHIERIPPYTTWIFLNKNQRMTDDQSVIGRRRIYYDHHGSEALICSDSEDELGQLDMVKHEFSVGEDRVLRLAFQGYGIGDEVLNTLTEFVGGTRQEIQERCNINMDKYKLIEEQNLNSFKEEALNDYAFLEKSLSDALDSFDNLFCRRCLVFDCRLHVFSQNIICSGWQNEKQPLTFDSEKEHKLCTKQCYFQLDNSKDSPDSSTVDSADGCKESNQNCNQGRSILLEPMNLSTIASKPVSGDPQSSSSEMQKLANMDPLDHSTTQANQVPNQVPEMCGSQEHELMRDAVKDNLKDTGELQQKQSCESIENLLEVSQGCSNWRPLEKDLYLKGLEIFGKKSCFIARNLLPGLKTCKEVSSYMYGDGAVKTCGSSTLVRSFFEDLRRSDTEHLSDMPVKSRICRKRGRVRKVKSSWKSAGHPSLWRRIADGKDLSCKHYSPCGCQPLCGKQCPCLQTGTCCEKYCGCSKSCKNRFRGCHCAKSQCKSRQCPCFAAGRECDPDVCRNCWVSCGGGQLGEPTRRGDNQCGNMKLLLRQQQRILLAKSDVAGWGAFLQNSVNKNDYIGEYTGELISHQEADKRGKIYDRANSSFLFDLNDKFVLDAYRKGDKLKFANHSATPNCHAKVMLVAGDHRVGIYANEPIESGQELFYDYRYGPDEAPAWARKPETSKRDGSPIPQGRAKKHQSG